MLLWHIPKYIEIYDAISIISPVFPSSMYIYMCFNMLQNNKKNSPVAHVMNHFHGSQGSQDPDCFPEQVSDSPKNTASGWPKKT